MGWTSFYTTKPTRQIIIDELSGNTVGGRVTYRVIDVVTKKNVSYAAVERKDPDGVDYVHCVVVLHNRKKGEFAYKDIPEGMGPCECECPERILRLLSPVESFNGGEYASNWRAKCRENLARNKRKLKHGTIIKFREPLTFTNGEVLDTFAVSIDGRKTRFVVMGDYVTQRERVYRISHWKTREFDILNSYAESKLV